MNRNEILLTILAEECGELTQRVSKILRFGIGNKRPGQDFSNAELLLQVRNKGTHESNSKLQVSFNPELINVVEASSYFYGREGPVHRPGDVFFFL